MHYKQNNKESKTYVQGLRPFGNTLPRGVKGILKKSGYNFSEIIGKWNMLVGKDISGCAFPKAVKMNKGNSGGTLILAINRGDEINIEYSKKEIMDKINSYFGYKLISEVKLQAFQIHKNKLKKKNTFNKLSKNYEKKINQINSKSIKNSLSQLLQVIKNG